jgi:hypothetical protein
MKDNLVERLSLSSAAGRDVSSTSFAVGSLIQHLSIYESLTDTTQSANCKSAERCWQAVDLSKKSARASRRGLSKQKRHVGTQ